MTEDEYAEPPSWFPEDLINAAHPLTGVDDLSGHAGLTFDDIRRFIEKHGRS